MSDVRGLQSLHRLAERESRSLMQYILGAIPWTTVADSAEVGQLLDMAMAERGALAALTRYLYRYKMPPPHSGGYPTDFTSLNFADLHYLARVLTQAQEDGIARLKDDLGLVQDEEGKRLGRALADLKSKHLDTLRTLGSSLPAVMS